MSHYTYIEAIGIGFPEVQCHTYGDGSIYEEIVWDSGSPLPSKQTLDEWIAANSNDADNRITVLAFRNRFTFEEKIAIDIASIDNPAETMQNRTQAASLRVALADLAAATFIDLSDSRTVAIITSLEQSGILTEGRASDILNNPILPIERPSV